MDRDNSLFGRSLILGLGVVAALTASITYYLAGYSQFILIAWLASLVAFAIFFHDRDSERPSTHLLGRIDIFALLALLAVFGVVYLAQNYLVPVQMNTDEITIMIFVEELGNENPADLFALSRYFQFPSFIFIVFAWFGKLAGGINLENMRTIHALSGLLIVVFSYLMFRVHLSAFWALGATLLVGSNHALIAISRMAMRDNSGLLLAVAGYFFTLLGLKRRNLFYSLFGGMILGVEFYAYAPGQIAVVVWFGFLSVLAAAYRTTTPIRETARHFFTAALGVTLIIAPLLVSTLKQDRADSLAYQRAQFVVTAEGQQLQQSWLRAETPGDAVRQNMINGLTAFNSRRYDQGNIYPNYGHGFLDPLSGVCLWIGLFAIAASVFRGKPGRQDILFGSGFIFLYLFFSLLLTKNPNYTRLLVVIPFIAYLTYVGIRFVSTEANRLGQRIFNRPSMRLSGVIFYTIVLTIVALNFGMFGQFVEQGLQNGNDVGSTARYIDQRRDSPGYNYYLAADQSQPYYGWGETWQWNDWMGFFTGDSQTTRVIPPEDLATFVGQRPFTVFMNQEVWLRSRGEFIERYSQYVTHTISKAPGLIAVEVQ